MKYAKLGRAFTALGEITEVQMTKAEAEALRERWQQQGEPLTCVHSNQELEANEDGYLTGNYLCTTCGEPIVKKV